MASTTDRQMLCEKLNSRTYHSATRAALTASKSKVCRRFVGSSCKLRRCVARCWLRFVNLRVFRLARMYQRAGWAITCMLGVWALLLISKSYLAGPSHLRGGAPERPLSASPSASHSQQWQRTASSIEEKSASRDFSGVGGVGMTGQNGECQMILDNRGNPLNDLSGPALPLGTAVTGEVSNGGYEYYTVCISRHAHHHRVDIGLIVQSGEADLYVSVSDIHPRVESGSTWIAARQGNDHISLPTYAEDFNGVKPTALFVGVHGRPGGKFSIETTITDVGEREIGAHMPLESALVARHAPVEVPVPNVDARQTHRQTRGMSSP